MLHFNEHGTADGTGLVIAHGLFGSGRNWGVLSKRLAEGRRVRAVDMRNHGASAWHSSNSYSDMAADLAELMPVPSDLLGHSMGGKAAMVLALQAPEKLRRLIVADIAPIAYTHTQAHLIAAMRAVDLGAVTSRRDAEAQLAETVPEAGVRAFLLQSLDLKGARPRWTLNLDVLEAEMDAIIGFPEVSGQFKGPVLFLSGGASDYVQPHHHDRIKALFPNAEFQQIAGAGHWLHAEKPREFETAVRDFLDR